MNIITVLSPINGHSKRRTTRISGRLYFPLAKFWSISHKNFLKSVKVISRHSAQRTLIPAQTDLFTEAVTWRCYVKKCPQKFHKIHRKTPVLETCNFFKKENLAHSCFLVSFAKFLRTHFLTEHIQWLLLYLAFFFCPISEHYKQF